MTISIKNRGKLKIFLGAAPGVGKTYSMLKAAKIKKDENIDVVIGVIETHARPGTKELLKDFEILSLNSINYKGLVFWELDTEKIIESKPQIILIDELAHSNIKGSKHNKRYFDIEEILNAGINVYSTLNIQHIESLNDLVNEILQINVHETIPDYIVKQADEIELIDLPPTELVERLKEGKIYKKERIEQALNNFFTLDKLFALREIALSYTAQSVNSQMLSYIQYNHAKKIRPLREKLMVCIDNSIKALKLIRECSRAANFNKISWTTLHVDTNDQYGNKNNLDKAMQLTEELGGEALIIKGEKIIDEIISIATNNNVTRIIVGKKYFKWWDIKPSIADQLIAKTDFFEISIVPIQHNIYNESSSKYKKFISQPLKLILAFSIFVFVISRYKSVLSKDTTDLLNNLFKAENLVKYLVFIICILTISYLYKKGKKYIYLIKKTINHLNNLYNLSSKLIEANVMEEVISALEYSMKIMEYSDINILISEKGKLVNALNSNTSEVDYNVAEWTWLNNKSAGTTTSTFSESSWYTIPINTKDNNYGVLALYVKDNTSLTFHRKKLLQVICSLAAITIENIKFTTVSL